VGRGITQQVDGVNVGPNFVVKFGRKSFLDFRDGPEANDPIYWDSWADSLSIKEIRSSSWETVSASNRKGAAPSSVASPAGSADRAPAPGISEVRATKCLIRNRFGLVNNLQRNAVVFPRSNGWDSNDNPCSSTPTRLGVAVSPVRSTLVPLGRRICFEVGCGNRLEGSLPNLAKFRSGLRLVYPTTASLDLKFGDCPELSTLLSSNREAQPTRKVRRSPSTQCVRDASLGADDPSHHLGLVSSESRVD
jgi:hypothetical protein